ncbi:MAG: 2OG-Fe dioxygenase family protein [Steroidobacteraceae bacterium]
MNARRSSVVRKFRREGYALLSPADSCEVLTLDIAALEPLRESWERLTRDAYLLDGGRYRSRRHSCFVHELASDALRAVPHRAHWQSTDYNALHGGFERWFDPIEDGVTASAIWIALLRSIGNLFAATRAVERWHIEAHQFRIDTSDGIGRPTPEGAHRDGVDFVALILVGRRNVRGGETRVFDAHGPTGVRFTMQEPWSALLMDDAKVIHETTPIQSDQTTGVRDTLVLTYRASGFQAPT